MSSVTKAIFSVILPSMLRLVTGGKWCIWVMGLFSLAHQAFCHWPLHHGGSGGLHFDHHQWVVGVPSHAFVQDVGFLLREASYPVEEEPLVSYVHLLVF